MIILRTKQFSSLGTLATLGIPTVGFTVLGYMGGKNKGEEKIEKEKKDIKKFLDNYKDLRKIEKDYIKREKRNKSKYTSLDLNKGLKELDQKKNKSEKRLEELEKNPDRVIKKYRVSGAKEGAGLGAGTGLGILIAKKLMKKR